VNDLLYALVIVSRCISVA